MRPTETLTDSTVFQNNGVTEPTQPGGLKEQAAVVVEISDYGNPFEVTTPAAEIIWREVYQLMIDEQRPLTAEGLARMYTKIYYSQRRTKFPTVVAHQMYPVLRHLKNRLEEKNWPVRMRKAPNSNGDMTYELVLADQV